MLHLQLAVLRAEPAFERLRDQVKAIAGVLEEKPAIPMVREQMALIQDVQTRRMVAGRHRADAGAGPPAAAAAGHADREARSQADLHGFRGPDRPATPGGIAGICDPGDFERFRVKARGVPAGPRGPCRRPEAAPEQGPDRLRPGRAGADARGEWRRRVVRHRASEGNSEGLGLFVRSLVGLDREAAKGALGGFLAGKTLSANQIEFVESDRRPPH